VDGSATVRVEDAFHLVAGHTLRPLYAHSRGRHLLMCCCPDAEEKGEREGLGGASGGGRGCVGDMAQVLDRVVLAWPTL
jgi:hypothetical protein